MDLTAKNEGEGQAAPPPLTRVAVLQRLQVLKQEREARTKLLEKTTADINAFNGAIESLEWLLKTYQV